MQNLQDLVTQAKKGGADQADVFFLKTTALSVARRLKKQEKLERSESQGLGLRVLIGQRQAVVSTTDTSPAALEIMVEQAIAMARSVPEDPFCGLADSTEIAHHFPDLDLYDKAEPSLQMLNDAAEQAEDAALSVNKITNSEGAEAGWSKTTLTLVGSNGFSGSYATSSHYLSMVALAGEGAKMERDYEFSTANFYEDLEGAEKIGRMAGERTVKRLNPRKVNTGQYSVVFAPRVGRALLGDFASAISGTAIARGTSFLKDCRGRAVFSPSITIIDDPLIKRGKRSRPFDGEGIAPEKRALVEGGTLTGWLLDLRAARQLNMTPTGHAGRAPSSLLVPSATNLYIAPGNLTPEDMMSDLKDGFYVTELMGMGSNLITGDYSQGAAGFWIENGQCAYPVHEMTIAGNYKDMFLKMQAADDLEWHYDINTPTLRIDQMTVAGV